MTSNPIATSPTVRIRIYRALGAAIVVGVGAGSVALAPKFPWAVGIANLLTWYIGKLLGIPVDDIIAAALAKKSPAQLVELACKAITAMPVQEISLTTSAMVESIRPVAEANGITLDIPKPSAVPVELLNSDVLSELPVGSATEVTRESIDGSRAAADGTKDRSGA